MASYNEMVDKDIELMYEVQEYCQKSPKLSRFMAAVVSAHPLKDIAGVVWVAFLFGTLEIGQVHFWVVMVNLIFVVALRRLIEAKRPYEFDPDLQPLTDTNPEVYAFPSLESYMSIVVFGHIFLSTRILWLLPLFAALTAIIGFSRIYSRSRFPHQIVASWVLGVFGLVLGPIFCDRIGLSKMKTFEHGASAAFITVGIVCHFAISMENNDSRLLGVRKQEFKRVIGGILHGGAERGTGSSDNNPDHDSADQTHDGYSVPNSPRTLATQAMQDQRGGKKSARRDSFYFLHKAMESRESKPPSERKPSTLSHRKNTHAGLKSRKSQLLVDAEDLMFHDSYSESSDLISESLLRGKLV